MTISFAFCSYMSYNLYIRLMTIFYHFLHKIAIFANQFLLYFMPPYTTDRHGILLGISYSHLQEILIFAILVIVNPDVLPEIYHHPIYTLKEVI